jgi:hypothetical protein
MNRDAMKRVLNCILYTLILPFIGWGGDALWNIINTATGDSAVANWGAVGATAFASIVLWIAAYCAKKDKTRGILLMYSAEIPLLTATVYLVKNGSLFYEKGYPAVSWSFFAVILLALWIAIIAYSSRQRPARRAPANGGQGRGARQRQVANPNDPRQQPRRRAAVRRPRQAPVERPIRVDLGGPIQVHVNGALNLQVPQAPVRNPRRNRQNRGQGQQGRQGRGQNRGQGQRRR